MRDSFQILLGTETAYSLSTSVRAALRVASALTFGIDSCVNLARALIRLFVFFFCSLFREVEFVVEKRVLRELATDVGSPLFLDGSSWAKRSNPCTSSRL